MGADDKVQNMADKAKGAVKETAGKVTGDDSLELEGQADQAKADVKQSGEKVKDALRDATS
ncbi:MAG: CsbD family protein [Candidatus Nanopelagicales bacterium]